MAATNPQPARFTKTNSQSNMERPPGMPVILSADPAGFSEQRKQTDCTIPSGPREAG